MSPFQPYLVARFLGAVQAPKILSWKDLARLDPASNPQILLRRQSFQVCVLRVPATAHGLDEAVMAGDAPAICQPAAALNSATIPAILV